MNIEIHEAVLEARIQKQIQATGAASAEEALLRPVQVVAILHGRRDVEQSLSDRL